jgi:hypothetical protein
MRVRVIPCLFSFFFIRIRGMHCIMQDRRRFDEVHRSLSIFRQVSKMGVNHTVIFAAIAIVAHPNFGPKFGAKVVVGS